VSRFVRTKFFGLSIVIVSSLIISFGCSNVDKSPSPEVLSNEIHHSLDKAGYEDLVAKQDKGRVILKGTVASQGDKAYIESMAREHAKSVFVTDDIEVRPTESTTEAKMVTQAEEGNSNYHVVRVFYGTDRKASATPTVYTGERSDEDVLSLGTCDVSIPQNHKIGEIERPSILRFEFREDPQKHVVLLKVAPKADVQFFMSLLSAPG
jgi:hypothetical protein